jgi:hypothetical protein
MKHFILRRRYFEHGTFSTLHREDGSQVCCIAERPWLNNQPGKSCIPEGTYNLLPHESPKFGHCYVVSAESLGVTPYGPSLRTHVLIHKANLVSQLLGCLAPGISFGVVNNEWAVMSSAVAFNALLSELNNEVCTLAIYKD